MLTVADDFAFESDFEGRREDAGRQRAGEPIGESKGVTILGGSTTTVFCMMVKRTFRPEYKSRPITDTTARD